MIKITQKNIKLASHAGFCYGVKRAVETTKKIKQENPEKNIYILGELIHNSQVIKELDKLGIKTVEKLPENESGICIIRSHGESYEALEDIKNQGYEIVDLTCLDVKKVQNKAVELSHGGYFLIILGKKEHPEVVAIEANARMFAQNPKNVYVATSLKNLKEIEPVLKKQEKIGVVVQTTQKIEYLKEVTDYLIPISKELKIINTICASTALRQNEARNLAKESDLMIVIGSKKSANTTHLADILKEITPTIHIEDKNELEKYKKEVENAKNIGVTAGASTPDYIINEILQKIN